MATTGTIKRRHLVSGESGALVRMLEPTGIELLKGRDDAPLTGEVSTVQCGDTLVFSIRLGGPAFIEQAGRPAVTYLSAPAGLAVELTEPSRTFAIEGTGLLYGSRQPTRIALKADTVLRGVVFSDVVFDRHRADWFPDRATAFDSVVRYARAQAAPIDRFLDFVVREALLEAAPGSTPMALARQMSALADLLIEQDVDAIEAAPADWSVAPRHLKRAEAFVLANLGGDLSIEGIAQASGVSRRSLHRAFQDFRGQSLGQFVRNARIEAARKLVSDNPSLSLKVAASRVGYADYSSFWRHYRGRFGVSPSERGAQLAA